MDSEDNANFNPLLVEREAGVLHLEHNTDTKGLSGDSYWCS